MGRLNALAGQWRSFSWTAAAVPHPPLLRRKGNSFASFASSAATTTTSTASTPRATREERLELIGAFYEASLASTGCELVTNPYELDRHGRGESFHPTQPPEAILKPTSEEQVSAILSFCHEHSVPVVPFGVGTSVEGHVCCLEGGISLDTVNLNSIQLPSDLSSSLSSSDDALPDPIARVGAGVTRHTLNQALRHTGLQFVVDPGADATIGGMVATGASGTTAVRYGTMRENLLEVECVLADGTLVRSGTKALKNSAGYDMTSLLCGSEGTLGVITAATVKLHPIPQHAMAAVCVFPSLHAAANAVATLKFCGVPLLRCELLDGPSVAAFNAYNPGEEDLPVAPTLFLEFAAESEATLSEQVKATAEVCDDLGGSGFEFTSSEEDRKKLWAARHSLYYASIHSREGASNAILTDACVPLSRFAEVLEATAADVKAAGVVGPCFGHAGDGNFHCILPVKDDDPPEYLEKLHAINDRLIKRTLSAGGTCTGEHGVGYGKAKYLSAQYGDGAVFAMRAIKAALDPQNILNPGKIVPPAL